MNLDDAVTTESMEFGHLVIDFDERVLRPRPWTAMQSRWAAELVANAPDGKVLELCSGAGHIGLLAIALEPRALVCVDLNPAACSFTRSNAARAGLTVEVRQGDLAEALALDIPARRHGGSTDDDESVTAELMRARQEIVDAGGEDTVQLSDGSTLASDLVVAAMGAVPATGWLEGSGLSLDDGVVCDQTLKTSAPGVYAAGDVARWSNPTYGTTMRLEHWTNAAEQGALAARNAINPAEATSYSSVPFFWSDWGDTRIQFVGLPDADAVEVVDGDPEGAEFLALYRRGDHVGGALSVNKPRPVMRIRTLIAQRARWSVALEYAQSLSAKSLS